MAYSAYLCWYCGHPVLAGKTLCGSCGMEAKGSTEGTCEGDSKQKADAAAVISRMKKWLGYDEPDK